MNSDLKHDKYVLPDELKNQLSDNINNMNSSDKGFDRIKNILDNGHLNYGQAKKFKHELENDLEGDDYENVCGDDMLDFINNCFHFCGSISKAALRDFILYQTTIGALPYHSFIINSDCELIIYPHDDCGLGFIISNDKNIEDINNKLYKFSEQYFDILEFHLKNDQVQV